MSLMRIGGVVAAVIGAVLLALAWRASNAPVEQVSDALTGSFTDRTMLLLVGGVAALAGGVLVALLGARR
jgi:drug/metabolite transporter (DMT)-like permease